MLKCEPKAATPQEFSLANMFTEADTCRKYVLPKLLEAAWDTDPHSIAEQRTFTDGRIARASGTTFNGF